MSNNSNVDVSIIIPAYNEEKYIGRCIDSLKNQTLDRIEIIVVDDGSDDATKKIAEGKNIKVISILHSGPGYAKNTGIKNSVGKIIVFFDADMYAAQDYIEKLIEPIVRNIAIGTYSSAEYVGNHENIWSRCWNINNDLPIHRRQSTRYHLNGKVFRAITKKEYYKLGGFDNLRGYEDDMTLTNEDVRAYEVKDAVCCHNNPESLHEVYLSARWIGRSPSFPLNIRNILRYSIFNSLRLSFRKVRKNAPIRFIFFKIIFDLGMLSGILVKNSERNFSK